MKVKEALQIVLELASQNIIEDRDMLEDREKQQLAIDKVQGILNVLEALEALEAMDLK